MSTQGGAGGAFGRFPSSHFACIRERPRNGVLAPPAHPRAAGDATAGSAFEGDVKRGGLR